MSTQTIPAVEKSIVVSAPPETAFRIFTSGAEGWWPLSTHSVHGARASLEFEARTGGRIVERSAEGEEAVWGEVLESDPPRRIVFTWHPGYEGGTPPTEVEVTFTREGDGTRVVLVHTGWEGLGEERGPESREHYDQGWPVVLERYRQAASS
jgi:uncharacterized protein YndB with AHSA1/START domain